MRALNGHHELTICTRTDIEPKEEIMKEHHVQLKATRIRLLKMVGVLVHPLLTAAIGTNILLTA